MKSKFKMEGLQGDNDLEYYLLYIYHDVTLNEDLSIVDCDWKPKEVFLQFEEYQTKTLKSGTKLRNLSISVYTKEYSESNPPYFDFDLQFSCILDYNAHYCVEFKLALKDFVGTKAAE